MFIKATVPALTALEIAAVLEMLSKLPKLLYSPDPASAKLLLFTPSSPARLVTPLAPGLVSEHHTHLITTFQLSITVILQHHGSQDCDCLCR